MTHSTLKFAAAHGHLDFHPAMDLVIAGNWLRHFVQRHTMFANALEWTIAGTVAVTVFLSALIFNS